MWRFGFVVLCNMLPWPYFDWPCNTFDHPTLSQAAENTHSHYCWGFGPKLSQVHLGEQHNSLSTSVLGGLRPDIPARTSAGEHKSQNCALRGCYCFQACGMADHRPRSASRHRGQGA